MKTFSLDEAQSILSVVDALQARGSAAILEVHRLDDRAAELRMRIFHAGGLSLNPQTTARDRLELHKAKQEAVEAYQELDSIGVRAKDAGWIDFPCEVQGETVALCWLRGESAIEHWHGLEESCLAREKLDGRFKRNVQNPKPGRFSQ